MYKDESPLHREFRNLSELDGNEPILCSRMNFVAWAEGVNTRDLQIADLATLVSRLARVCPQEKLKQQALDYLKRKGLEGSVLR